MKSNQEYSELMASYLNYQVQNYISLTQNLPIMEKKGKNEKKDLNMYCE